ncbi:SAM-dependent methyltransferase [Streptosporangium sp. NPDC048865]|uniref:SAM-dependent methyltransferase n=1 Tax=Streptosporangium sp. NPDC048865 TaxID=3155766 RepID=UPI003424F239
MTDADPVVLPDVDPSRPSPARVYDYLLGGKHNFQKDREVADAVLQIAPMGELAQANRAFLIAAVEELSKRGITQFIDIGSGLPTAQNVHQVAQRLNPDARVLYVDNDPLAVTEGRGLLDGQNTSYIFGDVRDPQGILNDPEMAKLIDLTQPAAVLLVGLMHYISDDYDPRGLIRSYMDRMAPGSYLVLGAATDGIAPEVRERIDTHFRNPNSLIVWRPFDAVKKFFDGLELLPPGVVPVEQWATPDAEAGPWLVAAGVAQKP